MSKIIYSSKYEVDLGPHVFPSHKYRLIKEFLITEKYFVEKDFVEPKPASVDEVLRVHTKDYVNNIKDVTLPEEGILKLEIPLSKEISRWAFLSCGGTILACEQALDSGIGLHCGGGFHHAFADHGEGFCIFNDIAVAIKDIQISRRIDHVLVIDLDLHQGNGTASIFKNNDQVFTFSTHQENIYPIPKQTGSRDVGLKPGTEDEEYLDILNKEIPRILDSRKPQLLVYQAGADSYFDDQLGNLKFTMKGLKQRDSIVHDFAEKYGIPVAVTLGGGYARHIEDTVRIHANTFIVFNE